MIIYTTAKPAAHLTHRRIYEMDEGFAEAIRICYRSLRATFSREVSKRKVIAMFAPAVTAYRPLTIDHRNTLI